MKKRAFKVSIDRKWGEPIQKTAIPLAAKYGGDVVAIDAWNASMTFEFPDEASGRAFLTARKKAA